MEILIFLKSYSWIIGILGILYGWWWRRKYQKELLEVKQNMGRYGRAYDKDGNKLWED